MAPVTSLVDAPNMSLPELQYRNNDRSENVQVDFTDLRGNQRVLSFVATRPHWCEEQDIHGDLFAVPLEKVFDGEADPVERGSAEEDQLIGSFREFVGAMIKDPEFYRQMLLGKAHRTLKTWDEISSLHLVWFLGALERRCERHRQKSSGDLT
jgi:hypothetical protein